MKPDGVCQTPFDSYYLTKCSKSSCYRANLLGRDAVTCCAIAEDHFTKVSLLSADMKWLAGASEMTG